MSKEVELPKRPAIPPSFYALLATTLVVREILRRGEGVPATAFAFSIVAAVVATTACLVVLRRCGSRAYGTALVVLLSLAVGTVLSCLALGKGSRFAESLSHTSVGELAFVIQSDPVKRMESYRCRATAFGSHGEMGDVWLLLPEEVPLASTVSCVGRFNPNDDDEWGTASRMQGVWGTVRASYITDCQMPQGFLGALYGLRQAVLETLRPSTRETRALLAGCTCGARDGLVAFGLDKRFSACGVSHLIAVSGSHMTVLSSLVVLAIETASIRRPQRVALLIASNGLYVLFCGAPLSAIRSWVMTCSALVAGTVGRRSHALSGVSLAGLAMVLLEPTVSGQMGFLLSVSSVAGLCLFSPYATYVLQTLVGTPRFVRILSRRVSRRIYKWPEVLCNALGASMVAQLATLPVVAEAFGEVSLVGPLVNVLISVPFTLLVGLGMVACACCGMPFVQTALLAICDVVASVVLWIVESFERLPFASVSVENCKGPMLPLFAVLAIATLVVWPRVTRGRLAAACAVAALAACAFFVRWRFFAPARICVLDVGQGDAILVQEGASTLLVDAGPDDSIADALARNHVSHLNAVLITHLHADHYEGLSSLLGRVSCGRVLVARGVADHAPPDLAEACKEIAGRPMEEVAYEDVLHVAGFSARVVWPCGEVTGEQNADSVELLVSYTGNGCTLDALLTGDAEQDETGAVVANGDVGDIDVLKVGHHGSEVSITPNDAKALDPEVSVASAGENNSYGHPTPQCVRTLEDAGSLFLCTKDVGDVEIRPGSAGPEVRCSRVDEG